MGLTEVAHGLPRFVLLGDPGAGKTTALRHLAVASARRRLASPRLSPLPLVKSLPRWREDESFADFIARGWPFEKHPLTLAAAGDLADLDGLNEMGELGVLMPRL